MHYLFNALFSLSFLLFFVPSANAAYLAYVPNQVDKVLHIVNTDRNIVVDQIRLHGTPREIALSHNGNYVFVSTVIDTANSNANLSFINVIDTQTNQRTGIIELDGNSVRGMALSNDDNSLFVVDQDRLSLIDRPGSSNAIIDTLDLGADLTYGGTKLIVSDDDKYLFVIGSDGASNDGISVIDVASFTEIENYSLGSNTNVMEIVFDSTNKRLFVALAEVDQVVAIDIKDYSDPQNLSLETQKVKDFDLGSNPVDLHLYKDNTELFVVLSYVKTVGANETATGNGTVFILNSSDITSNTQNDVFQVFLGNENSSVFIDPITGENRGQPPIHPVAIDINDKDTVFILKRIWSDTAGLYLTQLKDSTNSLSGVRKITETESSNLGNRASTLANGEFLGPNCDSCPAGDFDDPLTFAERPAAIGPFSLFALFTFACLTRRQFRGAVRK